MEHDWVRLHDYVPLTLDEIAERLARASLPAPLSAELLTSGKANTNYRVVLAGGRAVLLRLHTRDSSGAPREAAIVRLLAGIAPVPQYLYVDPSEPWSVQEWIDGEPLTDVLDRGDTVDCEQFGATLAAIGTVRFAEPGFLDANLDVIEPLGGLFEGYVAYLDRLLLEPLVVTRLGYDLAARATAWVADNSRASEANRRPCLAHPFRFQAVQPPDARRTSCGGGRLGVRGRGVPAARRRDVVPRSPPCPGSSC